MKPTKQPAKNSKQAKIGTPLKDVVPQGIKQPPRESRPPRIIDPTPPENTIKTKFSLMMAPEEWPTEEVVKNYDFSQPLKEPKFNLPTSFGINSAYVIFWRRPSEFIPGYLKTNFSQSNRATQNAAEAIEFMVPAQRRSRFRYGRMSTIIFDEMLGDNMEQPKDRYKSVSKSIIFDEEAPAEVVNPEIKICDTFDRPETQEELELRKKDEAAKLALNKGKKPPPKKTADEELPGTVKEYKLSNIDMSGYLPTYSKWIAGCLQVIKDRNIRDVYTGKSILSKIYPQKDGIPIYNPNGRYWIKLYFQGKERKIEINDKIPVTYSNKPLFPHSEKFNEIWPLLITKAILKLFSFKWKDVNSKDWQEMEFGDGHVMYTLTGLIPETIPLTPDNREILWKKLYFMLDDDSFKLNNFYIVSYSSPNHKPVAPSNTIETAKEERKKDKIELGKKKSKDDLGTTIGDLPRGRALEHFRTLQKHLTVTIPEQNVAQQKERPNYAIPGFPYSLMDFFENDGFNMLFVKKMSDQEIKTRQEYLASLKLTGNSQMSRMGKDEIFKVKKLRREFRQKMKEEDKKRTELINNLIAHRLLKVKTAAAKIPVLNILGPFTNDEINIAKKCILNKIPRPPNYNYLEIKTEDKSVMSASVSNGVIQGLELLIESAQKSLDDFSKIENVIEIYKRPPGGVWMTEADFAGLFEYVQIYHDPTKYKFFKQINVNSTTFKDAGDDEENEILLLDSMQEETKVEVVSKKPNNAYAGLPISFKKRDKLPLQLVLGFYPFQCHLNDPIKVDPYCILQKYDFQNTAIVQSFPPLQKPIASTFMYKENMNHIFKLQIYSPYNFMLFLSSNTKFTTMNMGNYLTQYENYASKNFKIDFPAVEKENFVAFARFKITTATKKAKFLIRLKLDNLEFILKNLRIKVFDLTENPDSKYEQPEGIFLPKNEKTYFVTQYTHIQLNENKTYCLSVEGMFDFNIKEGTIDVDFFYKEEITIEQLDLLDAAEYFDKYTPYKYGVITRERLFVKQDVIMSLDFKMVEIDSSALAALSQKVDPKKKPTKETIQSASDAKLEKPPKEMRLIFLELFKEKTLILSASGYNTITVSNIRLKPNSVSENYYLQFRFDLRTSPEMKTVNEHSQNLGWVIRIISSDTVAVIKDTQVDEFRANLKKSWEDNEPGRADKSVKARAKYLAQIKKNNGEQLDENELILINEQRLNKKQREEIAQSAAKGLKPGQKVPVKSPEKKPPPRGGKVEAVAEELPKQQRQFPKSEQYTTNEIKAFIQHLEGPRLIHERPIDKYDVFVRTEEEKDEEKRRGHQGKLDFEDHLTRTKLNRDDLEKMRKKEISEVQASYLESRKEFKKKAEDAIKIREDFRKKTNDFKEKEKNIFEVLSLERSTTDQIKAIGQDTQYFDSQPKMKRVLNRALKNAEITSIIEKLTAANEAFDIAIVTQLVEDIDQRTISVPEDLLEKSRLFIEEVKNNPKFVQEKLAELKKNKTKKR